MNDTTPKGAVLLLDDDKFLLDMYCQKFTSAGYIVHGCLSVSDALDVLKGGFAADAILFDMTMPGDDGFSFLKKLSDEKLGGSALKIALTNQSDAAEQAKATELGATRYIVKASMIPSEVVNTVAEELGKHRK